MVVKRVYVIDPEIINAVETLASEHVSELGYGVPLDLDWDMISLLLENESIVAFVAIEEDQVVGYCSYMIAPLLFSTGVMAASQHALFVSKNRRGYLAGKRLIQESETHLADLVDIVYQSVTTNNSAGKLMERLGYTLTEKQYSKRV